MHCLIWNGSGEPKEAPVLLWMACISTKSHGCVLLPTNPCKAGGTAGLASRGPPVHPSGGANQVQDSYAGVAKFSLPAAPCRLAMFLWGMIWSYFYSFLTDLWMKAVVQTQSLARVFKSSHNSFCSSLCTIADDSGGSLLPHIVTHSSDSIPVPHHCAFFCFSSPLSNFSELPCKADTFSSWRLKKSLSEVILSLSRLGMGSSFL